MRMVEEMANLVCDGQGLSKRDHIICSSSL